MPRVLEHPPGGTGEGAGYHDGGGDRRSTHGAGYFLVEVTDHPFVLAAVHVAVPSGFRFVIHFRIHGQT